jgi:hypothetical protein
LGNAAQDGTTARRSQGVLLGETSQLIFVDDESAGSGTSRSVAETSEAGLPAAEAKVVRTSELARLAAARASAAEAKAVAARASAAAAQEAAETAQAAARAARHEATEAASRASAAAAEADRLRRAAAERASTPPARTDEAPRPRPAPAGAGDKSAADGRGTPPPTGLPQGYQLVRRLGVSELGELYLARQLSMDRLVRLNLLHPHLCGDLAFTARFIREARTAGQFAHPALMRIYEADCSAGRFYCAMEHVEGQNVEQIVGAEGVLPADRARTMAEALAAGLDLWARTGLVHGGLGPSRVIAAPSGDFKLMSLSLATRGIDLIAELPDGAINYVAPELVFSEQADFRADIYSLGALLFFALSGRPPHEASSPGETIRLARSGLPRQMRLAGVAPAVCAVIGRAMQPDPAARFPSFGAMSAALAAAAPARKSVSTVLLPGRVSTRRRR